VLTRRQFTRRLPAAVAVVAGAARGRSMAGQLLIPMDRDQSNHLKAYGVTYRALQRGERGEWLLNYRSGSFLFPDSEAIRREAALDGVELAPVSDAQVASIRAEIQKSNMDTIPLEKAPKVAVYTEPDSKPWDDAVTIALEYAGIGYDRLWDPEVIGGKLADYEWLHLHHEDFTGQYSKFYITYAGVDWLQEEVRLNQDTARQLGFASVPALKKGVAEKIRAYVDKGGFLFAMCTATETLDLALAAGDTDISARFSDGTPIDPNASKKMHWERALAFQNGQVQTSEAVNAFSDIDGHQVNTPWRLELGAFTLFDFSAKFDPVPSMLTQCHESVIPDFYGLTTSFRLDRLKPATIVLAKEGEVAKYVHGDLGEGTFTYLGGHDPEDPEHEIGNAPTDLSLHPNSPGYRLILNNVLFPAAKKKKLKT
jgi:hypothetical protein